MATLGGVADRWLPSTPGFRLDEDIRTLLISYEVRETDLDAWAEFSHGDQPYLALGQNLKSCKAWDHGNPTPDGVVPLWPVTMDIDDAMAWLLVFCQGGRQPGPVVRNWADHTPHGWAFVGAGITLTEALDADGEVGGGRDWDLLRTMAALRGVTLPHRSDPFEVQAPTVPTGDRRPFMVLIPR